jgi:hypothetical protein
MVEAAEAAAAAQGGWLTDRHHFYPTTDIVLAKIPAFAALWKARLQAAVFALVEQHYGMPARAVDPRDLFVVRYAAGDGHQHGLAPHADRSHVSFNLALNGGFGGGGTAFTFFSNRTITLATGNILLHPSRVQHAGRDVTAGTRYILVGFLEQGELPWYQSFWRTWGTLASELHVRDIRRDHGSEAEIVAVDSMLLLLATHATESFRTLLETDWLLLGVLSFLCVLLLLSTLWLCYLVCSQPADNDDEEEDDAEDMSSEKKKTR